MSEQNTPNNNNTISPAPGTGANINPNSSQNTGTNIIDEFSDVVGMDTSCPYRAKKPVGKGSFAVVWLMVDNRTGRTVVGKFMDTGKMTEKNKQFALSEAENAAKCVHPNIIQFIEKIFRGDKLLLVFEYADAGDLFAQINARAPTNKYFKEGEILLIMSQLCLAMHHLHERKMMHRDLKTPNVFLTTSGLIKLGDFGFSRQYDEGLSADVGTTFCGTPYYLAPELWAQSPYGQKADVWSLGVVLYELMALRKPFNGNGMRELIEKVISGRFDPLPPHYSDQLVRLCASMLSVDPRLRPSVREVLQTEVMVSGGLKFLRKNVPKLSGVPEKTREAIVLNIDQVLAEIGAPAPPHIHPAPGPSSCGSPNGGGGASHPPPHAQ